MFGPTLCLATCIRAVPTVDAVPIATQPCVRGGRSSSTVHSILVRTMFHHAPIGHGMKLSEIETGIHCAALCT